MKLYVKPGRRYHFAGKEHGAGEVVDVPDKFAGVLAGAKGPLQREALANVTDAPGGDDIATLRGQYREVVGKVPFHAWDAAQIREKIATYRTTNMGDSARTTHLTAEE